MKKYALALEIHTPDDKIDPFLEVTVLSEPKRVVPVWKVGLAGILGSPIHFYEDEPHFLQLGGHLPVQFFDTHTPFSSHKVHLMEDNRSIWSTAFPAPFEEIDHIADIAFKVRGETLEQIHYHALIALSFHEPQLLPFIPQERTSPDLDSIIIHLNDLVTRVDIEEGCAFKAVSFHGNVDDRKGYLEWEMIIDV
jgi:hypothetical protein